MIKKAQEDELLTYDNEYTLLLRGYDVAVKPSEEENVYSVSLRESGADVFSDNIPGIVQDDSTTEEDIMNNVAQSAIDKYEADRNTLGQGAGAMTANVAKIASLCCEYEDWFMGMKGTPYEDMAYELMSQYIQVQAEPYVSDGPEVQALQDELRELEYQLKSLDLERMRAIPAGAQIIIVQGKKAYLYEVECIEDYLAKFTGCPLESEAVKLVQRYLEVKEGINTADEMIDDKWNRMSDIEKQMESLSYEALSSQVLDKIPTEGMEAFPNMANDIAELMEGISLDEPLVPMAGEIMAKRWKKSQSDTLESAFMKSFNQFEGSEQFSNILDDISGATDLIPTLAASMPGFEQALDAYSTLVQNPYSLSDEGKVSEALNLAHEAGDVNPKWQDFEAYILDSYKKVSKRALEEVEPAEERIVELGEIHQGLDPAESLEDAPEKDLFEIGAKITTTEEYDIPGYGGGKKVPKGTKGTIDGPDTGTGESYVVRLELEDARTIIIRVPTTILKKG